MFSAFLLSTKRQRESERERERRYPAVAKRRETTRPDLALGLCQEPIGTRARDKLDSAWRRRLPPFLPLRAAGRSICCRRAAGTSAAVILSTHRPPSLTISVASLVSLSCNRRVRHSVVRRLPWSVLGPLSSLLLQE